MPYELQKEPDGSLILYPAGDIPMFKGSGPELGRQAVVQLTSCLRHFAQADCLFDNGLDEAHIGESAIYEEQMALAVEQLIATMIALAGMADYYNIDIQNELFSLQHQVVFGPGGLPWD